MNQETPTKSLLLVIHHKVLFPGSPIRKNTLSLERPRKYPKGCPNTT